MTTRTYDRPSGPSSSILGVTLTLGLALACGNSKSNTNDGGTGGAGTGGSGGSGPVTDGGSDAVTSGKIAINGSASPFPGDPETDFTQLSLSIADPVSVLAGQDPLAKQPSFDTSAAVCPGATCAAPFSFTDVPVDTATNTFGLLAILEDLRPGSSDGGVAAKWVRTGTGIANQAQLGAAIASGTLGPRPIFAVSAAFEAGLAQFVAGARAATNGDGITGAPGSLATRGFVLAMILANDTPKPTPVAGATIAPMIAANASKYVVLYPNADFTGVGAATSATGLVLIYPSGTGLAPVGAWLVTPPAGSTATWPAQVVGAQANGAVVLLDVSN